MARAGHACCSTPGRAPTWSRRHGGERPPGGPAGDDRPAGGHPRVAGRGGGQHRHGAGPAGRGAPRGHRRRRARAHLRARPAQPGRPARPAGGRGPSRVPSLAAGVEQLCRAAGDGPVICLLGAVGPDDVADLIRGRSGPTTDLAVLADIESWADTAPAAVAGRCRRVARRPRPAAGGRRHPPAGGGLAGGRRPGRPVRRRGLGGPGRAGAAAPPAPAANRRGRRHERRGRRVRRGGGRRHRRSGSLALAPVFSSAAWLPPVLAAVLAVLAGGPAAPRGRPRALGAA